MIPLDSPLDSLLPAECAECTFNRFFRQSREAMFVTSRDGRFVDVNQSMTALLGYSAEDFSTMAVVDVFDAAEDRIGYQSRVEQDGVVHQYPLVLRHKTGGVVLCVVDAVTWRQEGRISGYHGIIRTRKEVMDSFRSYFNQLRQERRQIRDERRNLVSDTLFMARSMSDEMIEYMQQTGSNPLATSRLKVTILFFDIRNSSGIAECLDPELFARFLNDILTDIMDLVYGCHGTVNKLTGDGLMATFGAPFQRPDDALNAVEAGARISDYLKTFNDVRPAFLTEPVCAGIGLATGWVFAGVIGSVRRQEYTVLGDAVNLASRLESLSRKTRHKVLMDEATWSEVRDQHRCCKVFQGRVRGRQEVMTVYGLVSTVQPLPGEEPGCPETA